LKFEPLRAAQMQRTSSCFNSACTRSSPSGGGFDVEIIDDRPGILTFRASGKKAEKLFANESGGMRFQRVPPSEKRGRVHTSTITVSVLPEERTIGVEVDERDLKWKVCRSGGKGGQHVNKTSSAVQLTHGPSGIQVRVESSRSQHLNRQAARVMLTTKLLTQARTARRKNRNAARRAHVGSGMRGDKRRTIAIQRDSVVDHVSGREVKWRKYRRGELEDLW
jgi:peptide chain release factor 1